MKTIKFLLMGLITALLFSSCTVGEYLDPQHRSSSFDLVNQKFLLVFQDTKYPMLDDSWIKNVEDYKTLGSGKIVKVNYVYGVIEKTQLYYVDSRGEIVRIKSFATKTNGYPPTKTYIYDINNDGMVVIDWVNIVLLVFGFLFILFIRGT